MLACSPDHQNHRTVLKFAVAALYHLENNLTISDNYFNVFVSLFSFYCFCFSLKDNPEESSEESSEFSDTDSA